MDAVGKIWFSSREPIVLHLYADCGHGRRIELEHETEAFVEVDDDGLPLEWPLWARICFSCRKRSEIRKAVALRRPRWFLMRERH